MANDSYTQQALAADSQFRQRLKSGLSSTAWTVIQEPDATPNHGNRLLYAQQVLRQLDMEVGIVLPTFVMRPNVVNFTTTYDFAALHVVTAAGDPDILAQLSADWDAMAASAGFHSPPTTQAADESRRERG